MMLIDAHAHVLPRDYPADAPECFPRMDPVDGETARLLNFGPFKFKARDAFFDAERRVQAMEESGVDDRGAHPDAAVAALRPSGGRRVGHRALRQRSIAALCAAVPDRLFSFGMVPMQDPEIASRRIDDNPRHRAVRRGDRLQRARRIDR